MKRIFILFIFVSSFVFSAIDDCKTDVYFGNGILTEDPDAKDNAYLLEESIKYKFGFPYFKKHIGKVDYAYNSTDGEISDLLESLAQKLEGSVISYFPYVGQVSLLLNLATAESQNRDVRLQVAKYRASIEGGNKVLLVAHSQGNLFGRKSLISLTQNPKDFWMGNYFEAVSVASPMFSDIKDNTPRIDWDNDIVSAIALGAGGGSVDNPVRYLRWSLIRPDIGIAWREKVPSGHAWKSQIGGESPEGHYKSNSSLGLSSVVHAFTFYMGESLAERNYFDNTEMNSTKARDKILLAIDGKLNNGKQCPCSKGTKEPIETQNGAIEVTLSWTCGNNIDMDLTLSGPNVQVDVADGDSDYMEHAYVATQAEIKPGDKFVAKGEGKKKPDSDLDDTALENNPIDVYAVVKTPSGSKFKQYEVKSFDQLNLGEFAEIEVKDNRRYETVVDYSGYTNPYRPQPKPNPRPWVRTYNECDDEDKKHTCGCVPCEYIIHGMDGAVEYGPIGGAEVEVIRADTYGSTSPVVVYRGKTTDDPDLFKSGLVKFTQSDYAKFEDDVYYVVDAKGGSDLDRDDDLVKDATPTVNNGTIHAIIRGSDLKTVAFRVNALTEAIYQTSGDLLGDGYDAVKLDEKLLQASQKLFREKTFIFNNELNINYHDALLWTPGVDKKKLFKPYDTFVEPIVVKTYADVPRVKESYRLIYELLDTDAPQLSPLAVEIPHTIPNGSIIGKITIASEGVSGIKEIVLQGEANASFSIDKEGLVKIVDNTNLTIDALYKLEMIAVGNDAKKGIGMELVVKVVEGVPLSDPNATVPSLESVTLHDVPENSAGGTVVADTHFVDSSLNIVSYTLSGEDNASFSIDNNGQITVKEGADLDYEKSDTYSVKVSATNEAGNESFPVRLSIKILNEIDTPLHDLVYLVHLSENVPLGTKVGVIEKLREGRSPIDSFDILNPSVPFAVDVNGTIRTTGYIDYESVEEYNLIAMAKTASGNGNKVELQILIDDIYPETGKPTLQAFTGTVDENANAGTEVGALTLNQGASVVERITLRGTGYSNFNVDANGSITVAEGATLDYEQKSSYALEAIAHNANGSSAWVNVQINLNNLDDEAPTLLTLTKYVEENATAHTVIGALRIASNGEGNITDYTLTGAGSENFSIDENGTISVSNSANLDYETTTSYSLEATVLSDAGESEPTSVRIYILNIPENPPVLKPLTLNIEENATIGTVLGKVQEDAGGDSPIVSYTLDDNSTFSIDANGTVRVEAPLDYETQTQYTLQVTASNIVGTSEAVAVTVNILNIIDDEPVLNDANFTVLENTPIGTIVGKIDINSTGTSVITSMRLEGIGAEKFSVDVSGTVRVVGEIDYEEYHSFVFLVKAINNLAESRPVSVRIDVQDIVDSQPYILNERYSIEENATKGSKVGQIRVPTMYIQNENISYKIVKDDLGALYLDKNGTIYIAKEGVLDYEKNPSYTFDVTVSNSYGTSLPTEMYIDLINIGTIPIVQPSHIFVPFDKDLVSATVIGSIYIDNGDGTISAISLEGNGSEYFDISFEGEISLISDMNITEETTYTLKIQAENEFGVSMLEDLNITFGGISNIDAGENMVVYANKAFVLQGMVDEKYRDYINEIRWGSPDTDKINCVDGNLTSCEIAQGLLVGEYQAVFTVEYKSGWQQSDELTIKVEADPLDNVLSVIEKPLKGLRQMKLSKDKTKIYAVGDFENNDILKIIDVSDPTNMEIVASYSYGDNLSASSISFNHDESKAVIVASQHLIVVNISDTDNIFTISSRYNYWREQAYGAQWYRENQIIINNYNNNDHSVDAVIVEADTMEVNRTIPLIQNGWLESLHVIPEKSLLVYQDRSIMKIYDFDQNQLVYEGNNTYSEILIALDKTQMLYKGTKSVYNLQWNRYERKSYFGILDINDTSLIIDEEIDDGLLNSDWYGDIPYYYDGKSMKLFHSDISKNSVIKEFDLDNKQATFVHHVLPVKGDIKMLVEDLSKELVYVYASDGLKAISGQKRNVSIEFPYRFTYGISPLMGHGTYLYMSSFYGGGSNSIYDISNIYNPMEIGRIEIRKNCYPDCGAENPSILNIKDAIVFDNEMHIVASEDMDHHIVDLSDKNQTILEHLPAKYDNDWSLGREIVMTGDKRYIYTSYAQDIATKGLSVLDTELDKQSNHILSSTWYGFDNLTLSNDDMTLYALLGSDLCIFDISDKTKVIITFKGENGTFRYFTLSTKYQKIYALSSQAIEVYDIINQNILKKINQIMVPEALLMWDSVVSLSPNGDKLLISTIYGFQLYNIEDDGSIFEKCEDIYYPEPGVTTSRIIWIDNVTFTAGGYIIKLK